MPRTSRRGYGYPSNDVYDEAPETNEGGKTVASASELTEEQILLLSGRVYGYSLGDSVWGAFSVSRTSEVDWNEDLFPSLVIDSSLKTLMYDLVQAHTSGTSGFDDFVRGKGKGLIGLLFGPPGLGKTLTAEAIAEASHLPLYAVSSGALGHGVIEISHNFSKILELSTRWKAVLLLDEADVFLARRDKSDLERNAIVSIFLRELEYYPGILLLTTNQAHIIDPAFKSIFVSRRKHFENSF